MSSFKTIKDKALDVDPDLRFMALEDFKKKLDPANAANIERFVDILFKLLADNNPDVKSQTIKLFPVILPFISNQKAVEVIGTLYNQVVAQKELLVPLMVLKLIFNSNSSAKFSSPLARTIIDMILPSVTAGAMTNELVEILVELVKNLNPWFSAKEATELTNFLINLSFSHISNSIGKKAVFALDVLLSSGSYQWSNETVDIHLTVVGLNAEKGNLFKYVYNRLELVFIFVKNLSKLELRLTKGLVDDIAATVQGNFDTAVEDADYDQILEDNLIKGISLDILIHILDYDIDPRPAINKFFDYNPVKSEDEEFDFDDSVSFSDDEMENETDEFDDGSWKLRLKAIILIKKVGDRSYLPQLVKKILESNEFIFKQAVVTINALISSESGDLVPAIEASILKNLNNENLLIFGTLIETILRADLAVSPGFVVEFIHFLQNNLRNLELNEVLNLITLIINKVDMGLLVTINKSLIDNLCELLNKNSSIIYSDLKILNQLSLKLEPEDNGLIFTSIVSKLQNDSKLLVDLKIELLNSLTLYVLHNQLPKQELGPVFSIFQENLNSELMVRPILVNLNQIFDPGNTNYTTFIENETFSTAVTQKLKFYLNSNNKSIYYLILNLFKRLSYSIDPQELMEFGKKEFGDTKIVNLVFENLNLNMPEVDEEFLTKLVSFINLLEDPEVCVEPLIGQICQKGDFFTFFKTNLAPTRLGISILALITVNLNLSSEIESNQARLTLLVDSQTLLPEFLAVLQYLSYVNLKTPLDINLDPLFNLLALEIDESVKLEVSNNLGYLITTNPGVLITKFTQNPDESVSYYYFNTIKSYLQRFSNKALEDKVWKMLLDKVNVDKILKEFNLIGETLLIIARRREEYTEIHRLLDLDLSSQAIGLSYTLLIMLNHFVKTVEDEAVITPLVLSSLKYFDIVNVEIKIIMVKNLINVFHNFPALVDHHSTAIALYLFAELRAYDEFKKIIPMGPYKYVIDEGLEIRKLVFELLYSIINSDIQRDSDDIITQIITKGLTDNEFDIINLSYTSLGKLIITTPEYLNDYNNLNGLIESLNKNLNKKLKSKATGQEIEVFQESLRNLIGLANLVNGLMVKYGWGYNNWEVFYNTVRKFDA